MEKNWPETVDELIDECQQLISKYDLYTLGKRGKPFTGETEPRVDGTEYLAGEYQYGVAMIPAQWVRHVLSSTELGHDTCEWLYPQGPSGWLGFAECSQCGYRVYEGTIDEREWVCCPHCGAKIVKAVNHG